MGEALSRYQCCCCARDDGLQPATPRTAASCHSSPLPATPRQVTVIAEPFWPKPAAENIWRNLFLERRREREHSGLSPEHKKKSSNTDVLKSEHDETGDHAESNDNALGESFLDRTMDGEAKKVRRGTDLFNERKLHADEGTCHMSAEQLATAIPAASVKQLGQGKWKIHGIDVGKALNGGFHRLDGLLGAEGISDLPHNDIGRSLLFKESLFKDLLSGERLIKSVPTADVAAGQRDLNQLSLRQLLRLRVLNLDFAPHGNSVHATFVEMLDRLIFQRLGQRAVGTSEPAEMSSAEKLGRDIVLVVVMAKSVPAPPCWVLWFNDRRVFLDVGRMASTENAHFAFTEEAEGVLEFVDKSEPNRTTDGSKLWLDMIVKLVPAESNLSSPWESRASVSAARLSSSDLGNALRSLKPVKPRESVS